MRPLLALLALAALAGCAQNSDPSRVRCVIDGLSPERADAVTEGVYRWEQATGGAFACEVSYEKGAARALDTIVFRDAVMSAEHAGDAEVLEVPVAKLIDAEVGLDPKESGANLNRLVLHEMGHAIGLRYAGDPHYHGAAPSVMHPGLPDDADNVQAVDLDAFRARWQ